MDTMDNQQRRTEEDLHWLGGLIDGEGTVTVCLGRPRRGWLVNYSPRIGFVNTDPMLIEKGTAILRTLNIPFHVSTAVAPGTISKGGVRTTKLCYRVNIGGMKRCRTAAQLLAKYVRGDKQQKLETLAKWIDYRLGLPHKHPQTEVDVVYLSKIREKPIDPLLSVPPRDRTLGSTSKVDEDTVHADTKVLE